MPDEGYRVLLSMTGYGEAQAHDNGVAVGVEVRAINSRYFKLNVRCPDGLGSLEARIETAVRQQIKRGTVQVGLRVDRQLTSDDYQINQRVLAGYRQQLQSLDPKFNDNEQVQLDTLLSLPGVIDETVVQSHDAAVIWPLIETTIEAALAVMTKMRVSEGHAMAEDLRLNCQTIIEHVEKIASRTEVVVDNYRKKLTERLQKLLEEFNVTVEPSDVVREVGIFSERSDISEEIVRLRSHLDQFDKVMQSGESVGRKLEFLTQEMFREINTIGSKANDTEIAREVIDIKAAIERMREMIQNVE